LLELSDASSLFDYFYYIHVVVFPPLIIFVNVFLEVLNLTLAPLRPASHP